jgi:hypothetical protein
VLFLEPLNPALPEEPQDTALPCESVMVIVVLLKVALMCATPSASTTRFVFFPVAITVDLWNEPYVSVILSGAKDLLSDSARVLRDPSACGLRMTK